jgi:CDP-diacylglycerol---serine O-phosphatidyltransferase
MANNNTNRNSAGMEECVKSGLPLSRFFPNMVTIAGLCMGLFAIKYAMMERWDVAVILIVVAAFVDGLDGRLARMLNASSEFGAQLDSFADFINFGVAPALTLYLWKGYEIKGLGWAITLFFIVSMTLRLVRFNVGLSDDEVDPEMQGKFFQGLPAPCGGALSLIPIILTFLFEEKLGYHPFAITAPLVLIYMVLIAVLTVSSLPTISVKKVKIPRKYASLFMAAAALFIISLIVEPWVTLPLLGLSYLSTIPFSLYKAYSLKR